LFTASDSVLAQHKSCPEPQPAHDAKYHPGQVWTYKTRAHETDSKITILKIETLPKIGEIIHIRVDNIRLRNCTGGPEPEVIEHAPFTRDAIEKSVMKVLDNGDLVPDFEQGYRDWREHCGGVYSITVAEVVHADELTFQKGLGCAQDGKGSASNSR
jgi:hypothetical protein